MFARLRSRRRLLLGLALVAALAGGAGVAVAVLTQEQGDVSNPDVEFRADEAPSSDSPEQIAPSRGPRFRWPVYGFTSQRTAFLPLKEPLRPPYTFTWAVRGSILLEFPPVAGGRQLFLLKNNAALYGISRRTGEIRWKRKLGYLAAASPAYARGVLYVPVLERGKGVKAGRIVAVDADTGRTRWSRKLA